ncbi:hypothetical protein EDD25_1468 [Cryobacterium psychrophilum]|nr:hypothetical protein EDD25_1468 [Cryobacterium psychrophilum]
MAKVPKGTSVRRKNVSFRNRAGPGGCREKKRAFYDAASATTHSQVPPPYLTNHSAGPAGPSAGRQRLLSPRSIGA